MTNLLPYINDPENPMTNFRLGLEYENMGQTGAAISFYLRTAERAAEDVLQYEALLRMALCFERQRTRDDTQKVLLQKAMTLIMDRPEAYFLLARAHERQQQYHEGWMISTMALKLCRWDHAPLMTNVEYPGEFGIRFEHGVCAWWVGHTEESRRIMFDLRYGQQLDATHRDACDRNLSICGWPKFTMPYQREQVSRIRCNFPGLDGIQQNHSQTLQDMFVLAANQGRTAQWYLEIGSAEPFYHNNTALLETRFAWRGISIDIDNHKVQDFARNRRNTVICMDATGVEYTNLLAQHGAPQDLGYLQVDCDPAENSYRILTSIPWDLYRFAAVTFEHDYYADKSVRDCSREFLQKQGYELMVGDIAFKDGYSYEDWWVHPDLVPATVRDLLRSRDSGPILANEYLFPVQR